MVIQYYNLKMLNCCLGEGFFTSLPTVNRVLIQYPNKQGKPTHIDKLCFWWNINDEPYNTDKFKPHRLQGKSLIQNKQEYSEYGINGQHYGKDKNYVATYIKYQIWLLNRG